MDNTLKQIFQNDYNRQSFIDYIIIPIFQPTVKQLNLFADDALHKVELTETDKISATSIIKYGEFITHDDRTVELYDVTLTDNKNIAISRVGIGSLIKSRIISNNAVLVNFHYDKVRNSLWRFSFIAYDSFFEQGEVQIKETNPKRYTYVFGDSQESYRTAIDRFNVLKDNLKTTINDLQNAFAVEAMSKAFFDEYRETHYQNFVRELTGEEWQKKGSKLQLVKVQEPSNFLISVFKGNKKQARNFCKKLLGQIVFLYFLQKKGWLGASDTTYTDGDKNFMQNFYQQAGSDDGFYTQWLCPLFYDTLNEKRNNDNFIMPDGTTVKIPFLNGGLFDKEITNIELMTFPPDLFTNLFDFFNRYNFTIYENSPEEHTIAIDPEMLGHIFENLLEDNKDKGAFYTPKPIVQYMTQESLIQYLLTHLGEQYKDKIEAFVKHKDKQDLETTTLKTIDKLLDEVKICDPAIGSGAFPMGLLQEIFTLKEQIAYDLGFEVWSPATVKENIIQNSIYGVDIEKGAVDIARLRFWLSLVVDEKLPKPLPNLAYKIVVGNSLVSQFEQQVVQIDWDVKDKKEMGTGDLFADSFNQENKIIQLLEQISDKQNQYFVATKSEKAKLKKQIRNLKLDIIGTQLQLMIDSKGINLPTNKRRTKAQNQRLIETQSWQTTLNTINNLKKNNKPFNHFDWQLDFPEILNPIINKDPNKRGFDIVIGNPPYINIYLIPQEIKPILNRIYITAYKKYDLYVLFFEKGLDILKNNSNLNLITSNKYFSQPYGIKLREKLLSYRINHIINFRFNIFDATVDTSITSVQKSISDEELYFKDIHDVSSYKLLFDGIYNKINLNYFKNTNEKNFRLELTNEDIILLERINDKSFSLSDICYVNYGCRIVSKVSSKVKSDYIFSENNEGNYKKFIEGRNIRKYKIIKSNKYLDYCPDEHYNALFEELFVSKKLVSKDVVGKNGISIAYDDVGIFNDHTIVNAIRWIDLKSVQYKNVSNEIVKKDLNLSGSYKYEFLLAVLNSKLNNYYFIKLNNIDLHFYPNTLQNMPVPFVQDEMQNIFFKVITFVLFMNKIDLAIEPTLVQLIDSMVYELYFPDLIQQNNCEVIKYLGDLPELPKDKTDKQKLAIIEKLIQKLSDKNHKLYQNSQKMRQIAEIALIEKAYPQTKQTTKKKI